MNGDLGCEGGRRRGDKDPVETSLRRQGQSRTGVPGGKSGLCKGQEEGVSPVTKGMAREGREPMPLHSFVHSTDPTPTPRGPAGAGSRSGPGHRGNRTLQGRWS